MRISGLDVTEPQFFHQQKKQYLAYKVSTNIQSDQSRVSDTA